VSGDQIQPRRVREVVSPEGVPLHFEVAPVGDRLGALALDLMWIGLGTGAVLFALAMALRVGGQSERFGDLAMAVLLLASFLIRTFYFAFFELTWRGQTPGKRRTGLRVVDARGGALTAEAILTRNLTRELELFLPLVALTAPAALLPDAPGWAGLLALAWGLIFGLLPLFNRERQRVGDFVAGTVVVRLPSVPLLHDLVAVHGGPEVSALRFTPAQLEVYGVYELQVLEQVLRDEGKPGYASALAIVASRVRAKIGWDGPPAGDEVFLRAFYAALRARLEHRLLLGRRRADKHDRGAAS